jgi:hypothetical protein
MIVLSFLLLLICLLIRTRVRCTHFQIQTLVWWKWRTLFGYMICQSEIFQFNYAIKKGISYTQAYTVFFGDQKKKLKKNVQ